MNVRSVTFHVSKVMIAILILSGCKPASENDTAAEAKSEQVTSQLECKLQAGYPIYMKKQHVDASLKPPISGFPPNSVALTDDDDSAEAVVADGNILKVNYNKYDSLLECKCLQTESQSPNQEIISS
jgi:hypothetical protein